MAKVLGLDLGSNSIGWAVVDNERHCIESAGSRIIPMDAGRLGDFEKGNSVSFTKERTQYRGARRLCEKKQYADTSAEQASENLLHLSQTKLHLRKNQLTILSIDSIKLPHYRILR